MVEPDCPIAVEFAYTAALAEDDRVLAAETVDAKINRSPVLTELEDFGIIAAYIAVERPLKVFHINESCVHRKLDTHVADASDVLPCLRISRDIEHRSLEKEVAGGLVVEVEVEV